jgi:CRP/FNR family cyclic AMP-dependent transcriptional regulator
MKLLAETIREIPIFSGLSREDIAKVLSKMEECSFSAGTIIFSQGDTGDAFYFIDSGAVQVVVKGATGRSESVSLLGPQDWFGEMAMVAGELRSATIITVKETVLWKLSRDAWNEIVKPPLL